VDRAGPPRRGSAAGPGGRGAIGHR
jgi:hypothetical protein